MSPHKPLTPLKRKVFLAPIKADEISSGGIVLTGAAKESQQVAKVVATGPLVTEVSPGDTVLLNRYVGDSAEVPNYDGTKTVYLVVTPEDIFGVLEEADGQAN